MKHRRAVLCSMLLFGLGATSLPVAGDEPDLVLSNVRVKRLDACHNELRFKVKLKQPSGSLNVGTVTSSEWEPVWRYRIGLYSAEESGFLLHTIAVKNHPASKKIPFSLPSSTRLDCRNPNSPAYVTRVRIQVDDLDEHVEAEENNIATVDWKLQAGSGFNTCYVAAGVNPCENRPTAQAVNWANPGK